ncbi:MAG: hypothetical protein JXA46_14805 [Dehalococcoidales bacterium]|nr:hypothetical protein [Dehalococcoidales bacterium]
MKKVLLTAIVLAICVLTLVGCSESSPGTTQAPSSAAVKSPAQSSGATPLSPAEKPPASTPAESEAGQPQYGGVLTILAMSVPTAMGAPWEGSMGWSFVGRCALETLVTNDDNEVIQPWLAESWETAPDGKSIVFNLRKGIKFQDGTDFNAEAVKYNLEAWPKASSGSVALRNVTSIDVLDIYTVRLNLKQFDSLLLLQLSQADVGLMVSPTAAEKLAMPETRALTHCVGTGPFKLVSLQNGVEAEFEKNNDYWQEGRPYLDGIVWRFIEDKTVKAMAFETGDGQFMEPLMPIDVINMQEKDYDIGIGGLGGVGVLIPDGANEDSPFADVRVRQAMEYAIDKKALTEGVFMGVFEPAYQMASSSNAYYVPGLQQREYNPQKARELLAEAGYPDGLDTTYNCLVLGNKDLYTAVQTYLQEADINARMELIDLARYTDMTQKGWNGLLFPGFSNVTSNIVSLVSGWGITTTLPSMYRPEGWDEKWEAVTLQSDSSLLVKQLQELIKLMSDEAITIPLFQSYPRYATNGKVHDIDYKGKQNNWYYDLVNAWMSK